MIRTPDQRVRVFVSSTLTELAPEREAVRAAITQLRLTPVLFELGARPYPPRDLYRAYLRQSDVFIGIYAESYGWIAPGMEISGLEDEYRLSAGKPRLIYTKEAAQREPRLTSFLDAIRAEGVVSYRHFDEAGELGRLVADDLALMLTERFISPPVARPSRHSRNRPGLHPRHRGTLPRPAQRRTGLRARARLAYGCEGSSSYPLRAAGSGPDLTGGKARPGEHELLVKVHATTVNRTDCHYRSGKPWIMRPLLSGLARPRAKVLGNEFAGQVVAAGNGVTSFRIGDRVFGYTEGPFGAHAEYLVIAEDGRVAVMPPNLDYQQAAPATEGAHYALSHIRRAKIGSGHNVMVYGATGAIGSAAVQLLKTFGATVTAVCATPRLALIRTLGADQLLRSSKVA